MNRTMTLAICLLLVACSPGSTGQEEILVSAAASLTDAFGDLESAFEAEHPDVDVILNLGGSSSLREQILGRVPADVFASANEPTMDEVVMAGEVSADPRVFATNSLVVAVPAGNPGGVTGLDDFSRDELLLGLCAEGVPCGDFARAVLEMAGVTPEIDTNEPDVRSLLTKIALGELDAGITYATDVSAAGGDVVGIEIDPGVNVTASYPIAVLAGAPNPSAAADFVEFVLSPAGQEILALHGFGAP